MKTGLKRGGFERVGGLAGMVGGLKPVGGFCGWIDEADVEVLDRRADYGIPKWELQSKLGLQMFLFDPYTRLTTDIDHKIILSFVAFVNIVLIKTLL